MISAIVAVDNNWGIGYNGNLLEHIPEDLKYFKELTSGYTVVMGRKTWDSLPKKPLHNRFNVVITSQERHFEEMTAFIPFPEAVSHLKHSPKEDDQFIIGGGQIYKELLPYCDRVYITKIFKNHDNIDTYFPNLDNMKEWTLSSLSKIYNYNDIRYQFQIYNRII